MAMHVGVRDKNVIDIRSINQNMQKRILVIEDTIAWSQMLKYSLTSSLKQTVITANSFDKAQEMLTQYTFDAAVSDLCLPDAPNGEIIALLIEHKIPTWVLTGSIDEKVKQLFLEQPIVDYIVKGGSFCLDYISSSIQRYWSNKNRYALVIDDALSFRQQYKYILEVQNMTVLTAANGKEGIEILKNSEHPISLVLTDYQMPEMDGIEFCRTARQVFNKNILSIIALSSSNDHIAAEFLKSGANDFLSKPFSREELVCRINQNIDAIEHILQIQKLIDTDFLTGIFNRRHCFTHGATAWKKWIEKNGFATAVMADIDFFKKVNDVYGHDIGDAVIKALAKKVHDYAQHVNGLAYRLGGEEFAMLLPLAYDDANNLLEQLRTEVEALIISMDDHEVKFTISIGSYLCINVSDDLDVSLKHADVNLYTSKHSGRNQLTATKDSSSLR
jgi:diguanylate cyclase (GGDEF)-like protein